MKSDREAVYRQLFDRHYRGVFYFFARRGFDTEECRDLAQETFLRVYRGLDQYRSEATYGTWIRSIMRNLWLNRIRDTQARKRQASEVSLELAYDGAQVPAGQDALGRPEEPNPEEQLLDAEQRARLRAAIQTLPPQARRCQLLQLEGLKYREIAAVLGISIQAVRSHLFQARQRLEQSLSQTPESLRRG